MDCSLNGLSHHLPVSESSESSRREARDKLPTDRGTALPLLRCGIFLINGNFILGAFELCRPAEGNIAFLWTFWSYNEPFAESELYASNLNRSLYDLNGVLDFLRLNPASIPPDFDSDVLISGSNWLFWCRSSTVFVICLVTNSFNCNFFSSDFSTTESDLWWYLEPFSFFFEKLVL